MQHVSKVQPRPIDPDALGPLSESVPSGIGPPLLFPGEERFLRGSVRRARLRLWEALAPRIENILGAEEKVLYVAPALERIGFLHYLGLGYLAPYYHQVALVLTETRLVEVLLDVRGKRPDARVQAYPWGSLRELSYRLGRLTAVPAAGKSRTWRLRYRGDRKLLKLLLRRITERALPTGAASAEPLPILYCPACSCVFGGEAKPCAECGALPRSQGLAVALSLAFPGAGLLYAGHPVLALLDFLGEALIFSIVALGLLTAPDRLTALATIALGGFFFVATKLESVHMGRLLVRRFRPEVEQRSARWKKLVPIGAVASVGAIGAVLLATGMLAETIDRDLDFVVGDTWREIRSPSEWLEFSEDPALRSQWAHETGLVVSVFAYPVEHTETLASFRAGFREAETARGISIATEDGDVPGFAEGARFIEEAVGEDGERYSAIHYFVIDTEGSDVHHILAVVKNELRDSADALVRQLLENVRWIEAVKKEAG